MSFLIGTPLGRLLCGVAAGAVLLGMVYAKGRVDQFGGDKKAEAAREAKAAKVAAQQDAKAATISTKAQEALNTTKATNHVRVQTLIKEVPYYVTAKADADCTVPSGFVSVFNAAATGQKVPPTPSGPVDSPSGVGLSTVSTTIAKDFGIAYDWRAEALTWRTWYADQQAAWEKR